MIVYTTMIYLYHRVYIIYTVKQSPYYYEENTLYVNPLAPAPSIAVI